MDEPFASVDAQTRAELEDLIMQLQRGSQLSVVLITHDIDKSVYLSDRILVLGGRPAGILQEYAIDLGQTHRPARDQGVARVRRVPLGGLPQHPGGLGDDAQGRSPVSAVAEPGPKSQAAQPAPLPAWLRGVLLHGAFFLAVIGTYSLALVLDPGLRRFLPTIVELLQALAGLAVDPQFWSGVGATAKSATRAGDLDGLRIARRPPAGDGSSTTARGS